MARKAFMLRTRRLRQFRGLRGFRGRGFTLAELLVVIALIAILATITVVAVGAIANDARLSSGINTVVASVDNARALAMKNNRPVAVVFRARWNPGDPDVRQQTEVVTAIWSGDAEFYDYPVDLRVKDRFLPMQDVATRRLPPGIKVAAPFYDVDGSASYPDADRQWATQPELAVSSPTVTPHETPVAARLICVIYGPDGSIVNGLAMSAGVAGQIYVDFSRGDADGDGNNQEIGATTSFPEFFIYDEPDDECNLTYAPFLAVYDDDEARELKASSWDDTAPGATNYYNELTGPDGYITKHADRIHFNRYTGVVMR